jgi:hypothetical protein
VVTIIICVVWAVVAADAIWSRCRIRLRARATLAATKRPSHDILGRSPEGWRPLQEIHREDAQVVADENLFSRIGHSQRPGPRR